MSRIHVLAISICLIAGVFAGEYDLNKVLELAEKNNKDIQLAKAELKIASAEKLSAVSTALPQLEVTGGYNRNLQENTIIFPFNPLTGAEERTLFPISFKNEYAMNAVLRQTLFSFQAGYAIQAARYLNKLTTNTYEFTRQQVYSGVKSAFYGALLQKEVWRVAQDSEKSALDNYKDIKFKFDNGIVSEFELLQSEARWQSSIPEASRAKRDYQLSLNNLKNLVGIPIEEEIVLTGSLDRFPALPEMISPEEAYETRADYNALVWEKKLREKNVSAQRANFYPTLEGSATYTYTAASDDFALDNDNDNIILGLSLNIPIFSGGNTIAQVRRASAEVDKVTTRLNDSKRTIQIELNNLHLQMREAFERINAGQKAVIASRRAFEIAETRMANGLATQLELKDSRLAMDQAQLGYYSAIFDYLNAFFAWEVATGRKGFDNE
ncbi:MAG: TolC family protein [Calditrichota bacterium]